MSDVSKVNEGACRHTSLLQIPKPGASSIGYPCFYRCEGCGKECNELSEIGKLKSA